MRTESRLHKPIFLLADSQMLFWSEHNVRFLSHIVDALEIEPPRAKAAYLGASNGDSPEFFDLFKAAFVDVGVTNCMHVHAEASPEELAFLEQSNLILLAGGDVDLGYRALEKAGLVERLRNYWSDGAILIGVSAGAVQIGVRVDATARVTGNSLCLVPYVVAAHEDPEWESLRSLIERTQGSQIGLGIPAGGAAIVYPDGSVEPVRKPIAEVTCQGGTVRIRDLVSANPQEALQVSPRSDYSLN